MTRGEWATLGLSPLMVLSGFLLGLAAQPIRLMYLRRRFHAI